MTYQSGRRELSSKERCSYAVERPSGAQSMSGIYMMSSVMTTLEKYPSVALFQVDKTFRRSMLRMNISLKIKVTFLKKDWLNDRRSVIENFSFYIVQ